MFIDIERKHPLPSDIEADLQRTASRLILCKHGCLAAVTTNFSKAS